jgi:hypothetical protein
MVLEGGGPPPGSVLGGRQRANNAVVANDFKLISMVRIPSIALQWAGGCSDKERLPSMERPFEPLEPDPVRSPAPVRWTLPRLPVLIGVIGLGAVVTTGGWFKKHTDERHRAEAQAIQREVASLEEQAGQYRERFKNLLWNAEKVHGAADTAQTEPLRSWLRDRARCFDALVARIDLSAQEKDFDALTTQIRELCSHGDIRAARERLLRLPQLRFPPPADFVRLQQTLYFQPLAEISRQTPVCYQAFKKWEPEAARADIAALRDELAQSDAQQITPRLMVKFELLSATAPADDPVVADWATLATAQDYFVDPDAETLKQWRAAQKAVRAKDWQTAVARMQSITKTTVRTRQPFRSAYGRALLFNHSDDSANAYPLMQEAAAAGDASARAWVAQEDLAKGRYGAAARWYEAAVVDGENAAVLPLLNLYAKDRESVPRDSAREAGLLQRIVLAPDAPPLALMLLARLYESGDGLPSSAPLAFAAYRRAAEKKYPPAWPEVARCYLRGVGTEEDLDKACEWAARAYAAGERQQSVPILVELMVRAPDRTANAVQELLEHEQTAAPAGFSDSRTTGPSVTPLPGLLGRYFDERGLFGQAAQFYAQSGSRDPTIVSRHSELTAAHACPTCGGTGKVRRSTLCVTCGGKGTITCSFCDGRGFSMVPGAPPCTVCGGSGGIEQNGHVVVCSSCGGTGKGKGSVIKQTCVHCSQGRIVCRECTDGRIFVVKECPDCHGVGTRSLADR